MSSQGATSEATAESRSEAGRVGVGGVLKLSGGLSGDETESVQSNLSHRQAVQGLVSRATWARVSLPLHLSGAEGCGSSGACSHSAGTQ